MYSDKQRKEWQKKKQKKKLVLYKTKSRNTNPLFKDILLTRDGDTTASWNKGKFYNWEFQGEFCSINREHL